MRSSEKSRTIKRAWFITLLSLLALTFSLMCLFVVLFAFFAQEVGHYHKVGSRLAALVSSGMDDVPVAAVANAAMYYEKYTGPGDPSAHHYSKTYFENYV